MRWLSLDPGEDTGIAIWDDEHLVEARTEKLWDVIDALALTTVRDGPEIDAVLCTAADDSLAVRLIGVKRIVCEDWAIYPWMVKELAWDKCRTARGIGAIELICRVAHVNLELQPAKIKDAAVAAGAEELFLTPLHENRHANDAIMHGVYYSARQKAGQAAT